MGDSRILRVAASWLTELGAQVGLEVPAADPDEALWLGCANSGESDHDADIVLVEGDVAPPAGRVVVRYLGTSTTAPCPGARLDGRELAALGGVAVAIGHPDRAPLPVPDGCLEHMVGTHVAGAALAGLIDGVKEVEVAGVDVIAWTVATNANIYLPYGSQWMRAGRRANGSGGGYPYSVFDVQDGQFVLICRTSRDWEALVEVMGSPSWAQQPRYGDRMAMGRDYPDEVDQLMAPWLREQTRDGLRAIAARAGFPGGPVRSLEEVLATPALQGVWRESSGVRAPGRSFETTPPPPTSRAQAPGGHLLSGLRVLDLSWVWSGPAIGVALADLGGDVVKVESATRPDNTRLRGKPSDLAVPPGAPPLEMAPYFHVLNRGKRSLGLDLKTARGREVLMELAEQADVIVENLSPGVMDRFGIPPERVHERNPGCVFLSMRGYRDHPTSAGLRAYAPVLSAAAGIESLVSYPDEPPIGMMTYGFSDANAASQGLTLVLAALWQRHRTGSGAHIVLSQMDAAVASNGLNLVRAQTGRLEPLRPLGAGEQVLGWPQALASPWTSVDLRATIRSPWLGELAVSRLPWRRDGALPEVRRAGPQLGQHTEEILRAHRRRP